MAQPKVPALMPISQHPDIVAATKQITELQAAATKGQNRIRELEILLNVPASEHDRLESQVEAAMEFASTGLARRSAGTASYIEEHAVLRQQAEALRQVIQQRQLDIASLEQSLTNDAMRAHQPQHDDIRARYVAKLRELDAIAMEERALLIDLAKQGYHASPAKWVQWGAVGNLDDVNSPISMYVRENGR